jgi:hypothetical protein
MEDFYLTVQRANSLDFAVLFQQSDGTSISVDNTSAVKFAAKADLTDSTPVILKQNATGGGDDSQITVVANGAVVHLQPSDTATPGEYLCSITLSRPSANYAYTWTGTIQVMDRV